jgi:hypothetical protein
MKEFDWWNGKDKIPRFLCSWFLHYPMVPLLQKIWKGIDAEKPLCGQIKLEPLV